MRSNRKFAVAVMTGAVGAAVIAVASVAWACTPAAYIGSIDPESGPSGSPVNMTARNFNPGPVEILWDSHNGPPLATTNGPSFSVSFTIPDVTPGNYTVLAVQRSGNTIVGKAAVPFEVTPASATHSGGYTSSSSPEDGSGSGGENTSGSTTSSDGSRQARDTTDQDSASDTSPSSAASNGGAAFPSESPQPESTTQSSGGQAKATNAVRPGEGPSSDRRTAERAAESVAGADGNRAVAGSERGYAGTASSRSVAADLWSGFNSGDTDRVARFDGTPAPAAPIPLEAVVAGLLSLGVMALFIGFAAAEFGRRRATVGASNRP